MNWTTYIALYGAIVSTLIAYRTLTSDWPRLLLVLRSTLIENNGIDLEIKNESGHSLIIHRIYTLPKAEKISCFGSETTLSAIKIAWNMMYYQDLQTIIEPDKLRSFSIEMGVKTTPILLFVSWSSARLSLLPRFPLIVFIRRSMLEAAQRGA